MKPSLAIAAAVVVLAVAALGYYGWREMQPPPPPPASTPAAKVVPSEPPAPEGPRHPLPAAPTPETPLPPLKASDADVSRALAKALPPSAFERLVLDGFVRRVVATIDNLPREQYAARLDPIVPVPGPVSVEGAEGDRTWSAANARRYAPFVAAFVDVDTTQLTDFYVRYYPLFQQAYVELGYPNGYFNDRLVQVIDHLLAAPEPRVPIRVLQPKVLYEFADPDLQGLSSGQKALIRIGTENEKRVKAKLREIGARVSKAAPR